MGAGEVGARERGFLSPFRMKSLVQVETDEELGPPVTICFSAHGVSEQCRGSYRPPAPGPEVDLCSSAFSFLLMTLGIRFFWLLEAPSLFPLRTRPRMGQSTYLSTFSTSAMARLPSGSKPRGEKGGRES